MSSDDARVQEMIARACFGRRDEADFRSDLRAFLVQHGVPDRDVDAICASPPRLGLYRRLIRNNVIGVTERMLARTRARMNELDGLFDATLDAWLDEVGPRTHHLRDVPHELLAWAAPRWSARSDVAPWLVDLARHELVEWAVSAAEGSADVAVGEVALDRPVVLAEALRLDRYAFAVHELPADVEDRSTPRASPTALLAYRDADHAVRFLELGALAAAIVEGAIAGATLGDAVTGACAALGTRASPSVLDDVARLLETLGSRGILRGGKV